MRYGGTGDGTYGGAGRVIASPTLAGNRIGVAYPIAQSFSVVTAPADTNEDTLATITVPANAMGANGMLRVTAMWAYTSSANNKTLRIRYSGGSGTAFFQTTQTTNAGMSATILIANTNVTNAQIGYIDASSTTFGGAIVTRPTAAVDTTAATTVVITGTKASAGETMQLVGYCVELIRAV